MIDHSRYQRCIHYTTVFYRSTYCGPYFKHARLVHRIVLSLKTIRMFQKQGSWGYVTVSTALVIWCKLYGYMQVKQLHHFRELVMNWLVQASGSLMYRASERYRMPVSETWLVHLVGVTPEHMHRRFGPIALVEDFWVNSDIFPDEFLKKKLHSWEGKATVTWSSGFEVDSLSLLPGR
jgi:hypothetical protein